MLVDFISQYVGYLSQSKLLDQAFHFVNSNVKWKFLFEVTRDIGYPLEEFRIIIYLDETFVHVNQPKKNYMERRGNSG